MKKFIVLVSWFSMGCVQNSSTPEPKDTTATTRFVTDGIAAERVQPKASAVATYSEKLPNTLNDWHFKVQLFETKHRFVYKLKIQYEEITGDDDLLIPNLGHEPVVELRRGDSNLECVVGFLDAKRQFRPYKLVSAKGNRLKLTTIKHYAVTAK
jgi:hypothetical protein